MSGLRAVLTWMMLGLAIALPIAAAATSPLLAWREPIYIAAGFAGIFGLVLLFVQPLLMGGYLPGLSGRRGRRVHRWVGVALVLAVVIHVAGLWITSPPDVVDALLLRSPTPFSIWGVVAMWAVFAAACLAAIRDRFRQGLPIWRFGHTGLVVVTVLGSVVHAMLIEGTMEMVSKSALCLLAVLAIAKVVADRRVWASLRRWHRDG